MPAVRKFMTVNPVSVDIDQSIVAAARLMRDHDVGILPVTSNGELVGVVTDRDIVVRAIAAGQFDTPVKAAVTGGIASLAPDDDERQAAVLMSEHDVRRLPVADGGRLVGMVSIGDVAARADPALAGRILRNTGPDRLSGGAALDAKPCSSLTAPMPSTSTTVRSGSRRSPTKRAALKAMRVSASTSTSSSRTG